MIARRLRALLAIGTLLIIVSTAPCASAQGSAVTTYHNDNARTGQYLNETLLTPSNVNSNNFGKLGFLPVQGLVDGQPLYVPNVNMSDGTHNVVYVVTEHDIVYAFDADSFAQLWAVTVVGAGETPSDDRGCSQVTPEIGITSTPVINMNAGPHGTIYLVAMSKDGNGAYHQRLHALDLTTGGEQSNSPAEIQATYGNLTFNPRDYKERAALLLLNGVIYMSFASHCDAGNYNGWIMGYNGSTLQQASVFNMTPNGQDGAIWMSEGGLAADQSGNIYFLDANGTFDTTLDANGFPVNRDFGNSFMKLSTAGGSLAAADYFAMSNVVSENGVDLDLGSGGTILLPDLTDNTGKAWHLAVGAGKDKKIYVVNRDDMGKFNPNGDNIYQEIPSSNGLAGGVFSTPAYFNNTVYYAAVGDHLKAFAISNARLVTPAGSMTSTTFGYPGASPAISANGTSNGIVWAVENGIPGILHAYDAGDLSHELYNSNQAGSRDQFQNSKFNTPIIANGKVFINGTAGVTVFGLLNGQDEPPTAQLSVTPSSGNVALTVTASTAGSSDPDGTITSSKIDFGDGTVVAGTTVQHTYNNSGTYTVKGTVMDSAGLTATATQTVRVGPLADNSAFVTQQYQDILDRQPDSAGLNSWVNALNNGFSRTQLIDEFMQSSEFAGKGRFIAQVYIGILTRDADYNGFRGWLNSLESGVIELQVVDSFLQSSEFQNNFGSNLDNGQFVTRMYENVLLRQPDQGGYDYFVGQLNNGSMTRGLVALDMLQSQEFQNLTASQNRVWISLLYFDLLRRQPDSGGFSGWLNALNSGTSLTSIIDSFLHSSEYANRFQGRL